LKSAHAEAITALNMLSKPTALMYDLKVKLPAKIFDCKMARHFSYEELVPIAYTKLKPGENSFRLSERYV